MRTANVIVPCGGRWVGMVCQLKQAMRGVEALRDGKLFVVDRASITPAGCFADAAFRVPEVADPLYVNALLDLCREASVRVIIPLIDLDLDRLSPHLAAFADSGVSVVCSPPNLVNLCRDKSTFAKFADAHSLPYPQQWSSGTLSQAVFPLFAKRRRGFGSIGASICRSLADAQAAIEAFPDLIFQEFIDAPEVSVDAYIAADGRCIIRVPRLRRIVVGGESVQSETIKDSGVSDLADQTISALARLGLRGPMNIQLFTGDQPRLIEVNTRLGSASVLSDQATGGRFFGALLKEASGGGLSTGDPNDYRVGISLYRYHGDVFHDGRNPLGITPPPKELAL